MTEIIYTLVAANAYLRVSQIDSPFLTSVLRKDSVVKDINQSSESSVKIKQ